MASSSSYMRNRDRKDSLYGFRGLEPFTMAIDGQGNLAFEGISGFNFLKRESSEHQMVYRHRQNFKPGNRFGLRRKERHAHVPGLYPKLFHVLSGLDILCEEETTAITESGVFASRHQTQHGNATVLIFEETSSSVMSDRGSQIESMVLVIDRNRHLHMSFILLTYDEGELSEVEMGRSHAMDYCENLMSQTFRSRDAYNTVATVALSLGVYLSDVNQECLRILTNLDAGKLEETDKHSVGNITVGDLVSAGMAKWGKSYLRNDIAKCCFVIENGQLHVVEQNAKPNNPYVLAKMDRERVPRGSPSICFTTSIGVDEMDEFLALVRNESLNEHTADHGEREQEVSVMLFHSGNLVRNSDREWKVGHKRIWLIPEGCGSFTHATQGRMVSIIRADSQPDGINISWKVLRSWLRGEVVLTAITLPPTCGFSSLITNWRPVLYSDKINRIDIRRLKACADGISVKAGKRRWAVELGLYGLALASAALLCVWHAKQGEDNASEAVSQFIGYLTFTLGVAAFVSLKERRMTGIEILRMKTSETSLEGIASALQVSVADASARLTMVDVERGLVSNEETCACRQTDPNGFLSGVGLTRKYRQTAGYISVKTEGAGEDLFVDVFRQRVLGVTERGGVAHFEECGSVDVDTMYKVVDDKYGTAYGRGA